MVSVLGFSCIICYHGSTVLVIRVQLYYLLSGLSCIIYYWGSGVLFIIGLQLCCLLSGFICIIYYRGSFVLFNIGVQLYYLLPGFSCTVYYWGSAEMFTSFVFMNVKNVSPKILVELLKIEYWPWLQFYIFLQCCVDFSFCCANERLESVLHV